MLKILNLFMSNFHHEKMFWELLLVVSGSILLGTICRYINSLAMKMKWPVFEKLELSTLLEKRMRGNLIETFKIINGISNYGRIVYISPWTRNLLSRQIPKAESVNQWDFFTHRIIYFSNKLAYQIKNSNCVKDWIRCLQK